MRHPSKEPGLSTALALCGLLLAVGCTSSDSIGSGGDKDGGVNADCSQPPPGPTTPTNCGCGCSYYTCTDGTWHKGIVLICPVDAMQSPCGNGVVDIGEECDDGNTAGGDGCSSSCRVESGGDCPTAGRPCTSAYACGNGFLSPEEACDDGNAEGGDGCSADCRGVESGWRCPALGRPCIRGCEPDGGPCTGIDAEVASICGNGIVEEGEACDDGSDPNRAPHNDANAYGGCTTECRYGGFCGDGMTSGPEECDDASGNLDLYGEPGCSFLCARAAYCGDGIIQTSEGEECDLGSANGKWDSPCTLRCNFIVL